jgi:hypothetical protein
VNYIYTPHYNTDVAKPHRSKHVAVLGLTVYGKTTLSVGSQTPGIRSCEHFGRSGISQPSLGIGSRPRSRPVNQDWHGASCEYNRSGQWGSWLI